MAGSRPDKPPTTQSRRRVQTAVAHEATYPARKSENGPSLSSFIDLSSGFSGLDYQKIILRRLSFRGRVASLFQDIDLLLLPAQSLASPTTTQLANLGDNAEMLNALVRYTMPFNMTGSPTITLPCGFTDAGTPVAFQFVGRHLGERDAGARRLRLSDRHRLAPPASGAAELKRAQSLRVDTFVIGPDHASAAPTSEPPTLATEIS
jgi:amidase